MLTFHNSDIVTVNGLRYFSEDFDVKDFTVYFEDKEKGFFGDVSFDYRILETIDRVISNINVYYDDGFATHSTIFSDEYPAEYDDFMFNILHGNLHNIYKSACEFIEKYME